MAYRERDRESSRVYVGDLGSGGSKPELEKEFERYGSLKSVWVARNPPGFAFIEFDDPRDAEDAVRDMDGRKVCGVRIRCEMAKSTSRPGFRDYNPRRGPPPRIISSRYRTRGSPQHKSRSPGRWRSRSRSYSPRRSRSRSPYENDHPRPRSQSPPYRKSNSREGERDGGRPNY